VPAEPEASGPLGIPGPFVGLPGPRHFASREFHLLEAIVSEDLCVVLSEATSWETIAALDPHVLRDNFHSWICSVCDAVGVRHGSPCPIDGKALRRHVRPPAEKRPRGCRGRLSRASEKARKKSWSGPYPPLTM